MSKRSPRLPSKAAHPILHPAKPPVLQNEMHAVPYSPHVNSETSRASTTTPEEHDSTDQGIVEIAAEGDLVLHIQHETPASKQARQYRVSSPILRTNSKYFAGLLQGRFGESERIEKQHSLLRERYGSIAGAPTVEVPVVQIKDIGRISAVKSIDVLCTDFLNVLHGKDTQAVIPVANLANLAIVADRFDALEVVRSYVRRKRMIRAIDGKMNPKADNALSEERVRQRLLVAILLDHPPWMEKYSIRLITRGWIGNEADDSAALWWDLPSRLEEELAVRRDCILETIQSLQSSFVGLYTSRERQCKLGYDSSGQCDSFQLGEVIRFFTRVGTLSIRGIIIDTMEPPAPFAGDIYSLVDMLRQVPEYQIDRNHTHCGIRTRLVPSLDLLSESLHHIGICSDCWSQNRAEYAWMDVKRPLLWKKQSIGLRNQGHRELHTNVRALFTANERDWTS